MPPEAADFDGSAETGARPHRVQRSGGFRKIVVSDVRAKKIEPLRRQRFTP
jgi:hypothetical protein